MKVNHNPPLLVNRIQLQKSYSPQLSRILAVPYFIPSEKFLDFLDPVAAHKDLMV